MVRLTRRQLLQSSFVAAGGFALGSLGFRDLFPAAPSASIPVNVMGPSAKAGHRLRDGFKFPKPTASIETDVLILGGGIAGLSAGWRLKKRGVENFRILELESEVGGNSRSGENAVSRYPWGAHYVTLLNDEAHFAKEMFEDFGLITGYRKGRPVYNEYFLCQAPQERLFIYKKWQEGLVPKIGMTAEDETHARDFFDLVDQYRLRKGRDGLFAFSIPVAYSSKDPEILKLDQMTMSDFLNQQGWTSKALHWYVNYCCRDDYGTPITEASAWAGMHYFCARRGRTDGVDGSTVLTWPEGNGWLVHKLRERLRGHIATDSMGLSIKPNENSVTVDAWSEGRGEVTEWKARSLIVAIPRFIAAHLNPALFAGTVAKDLSYAPWMVANLTLKVLPRAASGAPLSWDNVLHNSGSLGYVVATHQRPTIHTDASVWTYYRPLDQLPPAEARKQAQATTAEEWKKIILADLSNPHPDLADLVTSIDVWIWGHAMARPTPGFISSPSRAKMRENLGRIHFAHSDISGISIFEEANYHGVRAADEVIQRVLS